MHVECEAVIGCLRHQSEAGEGLWLVLFSHMEGQQKWQEQSPGACSVVDEPDSVTALLPHKSPLGLVSIIVVSCASKSLQQQLPCVATESQPLTGHSKSTARAVTAIASYNVHNTHTSDRWDKDSWDTGMGWEPDPPVSLRKFSDLP